MATDMVCVRGRLTDEGVECQALRSTEDELYTLIGDLNGFQNDDQVMVVGTAGASAICMQGTTISIFWIGQSVDDALENSLKQEIKSTWPDQFIEAKRKKRAFSKYTNDADDPKVAVLHPTRRVAGALDIGLDEEIEKALQKKVDLDTTPEDALPLMSEALDWPAEPA
jgi:hypothetical protein